MNYNVFGGMLNLTQLQLWRRIFAGNQLRWYWWWKGDEPNRTCIQKPQKITHKKHAPSNTDGQLRLSPILSWPWWRWWYHMIPHNGRLFRDISLWQILISNYRNSIRKLNNDYNEYIHIT